MAQQGGFVRGQVEQRPALAHATDASSRHVSSFRYPSWANSAASWVTMPISRLAE